jgi:hypothetical protein
LQTLSLWSTEISDAGLKDLAEFKRLKTLHLSQTRVTDAGLKELYALKGLRTLSLRATRVTPAAVALLKEALPIWTAPLFSLNDS